MNRFFRCPFLVLLAMLLFASDSLIGQVLTAHAGADKVVCPGTSATLGGAPAATGGLAPYTYSWSPSTYLSSTTTSNPTYTAGTYTVYTLTVTDDTGAVSMDQVAATPAYIAYVDAGNDTGICVSSYALLGNDYNVSGAGVTYSWAPSSDLSSSSAPRPTATPLATTTYTLTASYSGCASQNSTVTVSIIPTPAINAGPDLTIQQGEVAIPSASGGFNYVWWNVGTPSITYPYTANPNLEPPFTTTYYLSGSDPTKSCFGYDSMVVNVVPNDELVFYNTFTPNNDGNNDTWYIGNIYKYPDNKLEIYNRNGKLVYKASQYINNWDGKAFGEDLPAATYFYVMDLGDGKGKRHGTVTIIK